MRSVFCVFLPLFSIFFIESCKPRAQLSTTAYIIGPTNDISTISKPDEKGLSSDSLNSSVLIITIIDKNKRKYCSGTLIEPESAGKMYRIITNHHCFANVDDKTGVADSNLISGYCDNTKVYLGFYKYGLENREVVRCQPGSFRNDPKADLAVFTLQKNPSSRYVPASFWKYGKVPAGRKATIIHFPAVDVGDKNYAESMVFDAAAGIRLPVGQQTLENCVTQGSFEERFWSVDIALKVGIKHSCDQKKGSSGSALRDVESGSILGVNWGGIQLKVAGKDETYNVATTASHVLNFINNRVMFGEGMSSADSAIGKSVKHESNIAVEESKGGKNKGILSICGMIRSIDGKTNIFGVNFSLFLLFILPLGIFFLSRRDEH